MYAASILGCATSEPGLSMERVRGKRGQLLHYVTVTLCAFYLVCLTQSVRRGPEQEPNGHLCSVRMLLVGIRVKVRVSGNSVLLTQNLIL